MLKKAKRSLKVEYVNQNEAVFGICLHFQILSMLTF